MSKLEIVNVLKNPAILAAGDIVGFNQFPGHSKTQVKGSSGLDIGRFSATVQEPTFRGFVLSVVYKGDTPSKIIVMPLAPVAKEERLANDDKNLTISNARQVRAMGLRAEINWRLNYMPVALDVGSTKDFALKNPGDIVRFGTAPPDLQSVVFGQVQRLVERGSLHSANFLPDTTARQLRGREVANYANIAGTEARVAVHGNARDAEAAAAADARAAQERREMNKNLKAQAARLLRENMNATPSGKIAYKLGLRFNEKADPDITIDGAYELDLINEDTFLALDAMKDPLGYDTLRTAFDTFRTKHADVLSGLLTAGVCGTDEEETCKAALEVNLKNSMTEFYKHLQSPAASDEAQWKPHIVPYGPPKGPDAKP